MSDNKSTRKRLFLIDGYAMLYRAHFAMIRNPLINSKGMHTSALFGFINQVLKLLRQEKPDYLIAAFDSSKKTFRHERYPEYKATREKMPEEMREQLPYLWKLLEAMRIPTLEEPGYEADDIIGTLAKRANENDLDTYIVSGDKDFMQLVNDHIFLYTPSGRQAEIKVYDREGVKEKWGVPPEKIIDLLGLMGDSSDNVPGVMGVGEKTAVKLLNEYGTLENALDHADEVKNKRAREGLQNCREEALLSQELVTIETNMEIDTDYESMATNGFDVNALDEIFRDLEFQALQTQLNAFHGEVPTQEERPEKDYKSLLTQGEIQAFVNGLKKGQWLSFDLETTSVNTMQCDIVGFSFSTKANAGVYIPIQYKEKDPDLFGDALKSILSIIKPMMEDDAIPKTGQNIKFDALILKRHGINVKGIQFDTLLAAHLLKPELRNLKLDNLSLEHLNYRMVLIEDLIGKGRNRISMAEVELDKITFYAAEDADIALQLTHIFKKELKKEGLDQFFNDIEMPLLPVLLEMEFNGMFVDGEMLETMSAELGKKIDSLVADIQREAGTEFNVNSTQQLANVLFDIKGLPEIKKRSTAEDVLQRLKNEHPIPELILEYRKLNKLKNTYIDALPALIHPETRRIHSTFSQTVAATGRLSSRDPNFQNIPIRTEEGREIRKAFRSEQKEWKIFSADYSQIELRIMAHLSQDKALVNAFNKGEDIHTRTAADVFNVSMEDVIPEMRRTAKIVNFGLLYGAGPFRMSQELGIPQKEAKAIIEAYFERYSGIKNYIESTLEKAREHQYVETMLGRRRPVWNIDSSNHLHREAAKRMAINMPIQGTNAEMIKLAMVAIQKNIEAENMKSKMVLQVHDELVFEVPQSELSSLQPMVIKEMEKALPLSVPIVVDCGHGNSWYEAH
ncbi:MAG: DNA polymerase I [Candidatus Marinimicrobia bacterium]|jgi:DNA polymerase-1|nr:DNA polymerase I [Candidatus Neomarinimicrobiota bacterium]MDP6612106.1 DNA polymerase I [Candidatus Neomarinimicrobiota bacterium]|tara:strand:- start:22492 stop:25209 length:2718 start_codon:yes stop_codon:yes gene_type:complete